MMAENDRPQEGYPVFNQFFTPGMVLEILEHLDCSGNLGEVVARKGPQDTVQYVLQCQKCHTDGKIPAVQQKSR